MGVARRRLQRRRPARPRSRRTSPTTSRRSIATSARACSRTRPSPPASHVQNRYVQWGAGPARLRQRRLAETCSTSPATSIPKSSAPAAAVPAPRAAHPLPQSRRRPLRRRERASGAGLDDAAFEPRRGLRRHRQRRRHRRPRHEHERAAVAAAQRHAAAATPGSTSRLEGRASNRAGDRRDGDRHRRRAQAGARGARASRATTRTTIVRLHFGLGARHARRRDRGALAERRRRRSPNAAASRSHDSRKSAPTALDRRLAAQPRIR